MTTRAEIQNNVLDYLNRSGDTSGVATIGVPLWFTIAHREIQRRHDFRAAEVIDHSTISLVDGTAEYNQPTALKMPTMLYVWNPTNSQIERFYNPTDLPTIYNLRYRNTSNVENPLDPNGAYYAWFANQFHLYPTPGAGQHNKILGVDGYQWLDAPATNASDWFTDNASDYLMYRMLIESIPFIGMQDGENRVKLFGVLAENAFSRVMGVSVKQKYPGVLTIRG